MSEERKPQRSYWPSTTYAEYPSPRTSSRPPTRSDPPPPPPRTSPAPKTNPSAPPKTSAPSPAPRTNPSAPPRTPSSKTLDAQTNGPSSPPPKSRPPRLPIDPRLEPVLRRPPSIPPASIAEPRAPLPSTAEPRAPLPSTAEPRAPLPSIAEPRAPLPSTPPLSPPPLPVEAAPTLPPARSADSPPRAPLPTLPSSPLLDRASLPPASGSGEPHVEVPGLDEWQHIWLAMQTRSWTSLCVVPASHVDGDTLLRVAHGLRQIGVDHLKQPLTVLDHRGVTLRDVESRIEALPGGGKVIIVIDAIDQSPGSARYAKAKAIDAALLVFLVGSSEISSAKKTVEAFGKERFLGSLALRPKKTTR